MHEIDMTADDLVSALLTLSSTEPVCLLDSCGAGHLGSHLLIAGIGPGTIVELTSNDPRETLGQLDQLVRGGQAVFLTLSYEFGTKIEGIVSGKTTVEPDVFAATFRCLAIHDYDAQRSYLIGDRSLFKGVEAMLRSAAPPAATTPRSTSIRSNFTRHDYLNAVETIKERIRRGDTYQANLTQQFEAVFASDTSPEAIFWRLRKNHPAPFAAYYRRSDSTVISASPERFFKVQGDHITTSPIKGTRRRGITADEDERLRLELLSSEKDTAENTMIVDLLRNDLGRVCDFGSVRVDKLCDLEVHPTLFHLVSTVSGKLRKETTFAQLLRALFPCGSITGAPKISTMKIIDEIEPTARGLSMGAIGYFIPPDFGEFPAVLELSVAIRTMVVRDRVATFNVGGGIVIDSDPASEYDESLTKARALFDAIGAPLTF